MPATKKTDNSFTADKVALRANMLPAKEHVRVLDAFGGRGIIWAAVKKKTGANIERTAIDARVDIDDFHLHGDNRKVMAGMDLSCFDVIDLDDYGVPADQIDEVIKSDFRGVVFVTMIQTMHGQMPTRICDEIGLPDRINRDAPSLVVRRGWEYFEAWLALKGVKKIRLRQKGRKRYFGFVWPQ